jgi:hypothetical protein
VANHGTGPASGSATIVGRQGGTIVFSSVVPVSGPVADGITTYQVRVTDRSLFAPGLVTWTVTLAVAGDVDGPGGDVATAMTRIRDNVKNYRRT